MRKKTISFLLVSSSFIFSLIFTPFLNSSLAEDVSGDSGTIKIDPPGPTDVMQLVIHLREYLLPLVGGIAIVFIAVAGILYIFGGVAMNERIIKAAKTTLARVVFGLILILTALPILSETYYIVLGENMDGNNLSIKDILVRLIGFLLAIFGTLAVISFVIGGIMYLFGGADQDKVEKGKNIVKYSIIGIIVGLSGTIIIRQIEAIIAG